MKLQNRIACFVAGACFLTTNLSPTRSQTGQQPSDLFVAVAKSDAPALENALRAGGNPNALYQGVTPLYLAATAGNGVITRLLLANGADPNQKCANGQTVLLQSVFGGNPDVAQALLDKGARPNDVTGNSNTALLYASFVATTDRSDLIRLVKSDNSPESVSDAKISQMQAGALEIAKLLITKGANVNAQDDQGRTALMDAASGGSVVLCQDLLAKKADVNTKDKQQAVALGFAAVHGHADVVSLLLKSGADINAKDRDNKTPLMLASEARQGDVVKVLEAGGATELAGLGKNRTGTAAGKDSLSITRLLSPQEQTAEREIQAVYNAADTAFGKKDLSGAFSYVGPSEIRRTLSKQFAALLPQVKSIVSITCVRAVSGLTEHDNSAVAVTDHHMQLQVTNPSTGEPGVLVSDERDEEGWVKTKGGWRKQTTKPLSFTTAFKKTTSTPPK